MMAYEAQIAGVGDPPPGRPLRGRADPGDAAVSRPRAAPGARAAVVAAVRRHADLEFVNGGGTGSVAATARGPGGHRGRRRLGALRPDAVRRTTGARRPRPAAFFALPVVRAPGAAASRPCSAAAGSRPARPAADRLPSPYLRPGSAAGARRGRRRGADAAARPGAGTLRPGDRVWFRHAKAGELCEHVNELQLVDGESAVPTPTYRGEGHAWLG